jgi:hypothetical protein
LGFGGVGAYGWAGGDVGHAIEGVHSSGNWGDVGDIKFGVYGQNANGNYAYLGDASHGAAALHAASGNYGLLGTELRGVQGHYAGNGNYGYLGSVEEAVAGQHGNSKNWGKLGLVDRGVEGKHDHSGNYGYLGSETAGVGGVHSDNDNRGLLGDVQYGVYGKHGASGNYGYIGSSANGIFARASGVNSRAMRFEHEDGPSGFLGGDVTAVYATSAHTAIYAVCSTNVLHSAYLGTEDYAGDFGGPVMVNNNLTVTGSINKSATTFKIDHPLDPENKYLSHSAVESPDMMNIYNGNVTLDANGEAVVDLPEWFEALNRDFRYQLTPIGSPAPDLYVSETVQDNRFKIAGGSEGLMVSWQVTGVRQDPYAEANRVQVERLKSPEEQGTYIHPDLYGQPAEKGIRRARPFEMAAMEQEESATSDEFTREGAPRGERPVLKGTVGPGSVRPSVGQSPAGPDGPSAKIQRASGRSSLRPSRTTRH